MASETQTSAYDLCRMLPLPAGNVTDRRTNRRKRWRAKVEMDPEIRRKSEKRAKVKTVLKYYKWRSSSSSHKASGAVHGLCKPKETCAKVKAVLLQVKIS